MDDHDELGPRGEAAAAQYLASRGMQIVATNWRCRLGEVDIIAREGATLVFCEVKTRRGLAFGLPLEAITPGKAARLRRLVGQWLADGPGHPGPIRIDAVGIVWHRDGRLEIEHLRGVA